MTDQHYDAIIVGSGAGGAATAFNLVRAGKRALVLERGDRLPRDGSTLAVKQVFKVGRFKNHDPWVDNHNRVFIPDEHYNVGGKTKWYGAALLRFSPDEFEADPAHQCLAWPFGYDELKPYYEQAEELLRINRFDNEPELQALIDKIAGGDSSWRAEPLPLGLKKEVLEDENEAKHFDGFASVCAYKSDAEWNLLTHIEDKPNFTLMPNKQVVGFLHAQGAPQRDHRRRLHRRQHLLRLDRDPGRRGHDLAAPPPGSPGADRIGADAAFRRHGRSQFQVPHQQRSARPVAVRAP